MDNNVGKKPIHMKMVEEEPIQGSNDKLIEKSVHNGRAYRVEDKADKIGGVVVLVTAIALLVLACVMAAGVFGGVGKMGLIAGGVVIGSMILFAIAARLLIPPEPLKT